MTDSLPNPLLELHKNAGAEFQPYAQIEVVSTFVPIPSLSTDGDRTVIDLINVGMWEKCHILFRVLKNERL